MLLAVFFMEAAAMDPVRYLVIGAGNLAQVAVLPAFAHAMENSKLVGIISGDARKRSALAERYDLEATGTYRELEDIVARTRAEAVYIAVPNHLHRELTERAARCGVHVLCEKPMAETVADCTAMIDACEAAKVRLMIAYRLHFEEANLRAIELVKSGRIGEPRLFSAVFTQQVRPGDVRTEKALAGGALYDVGIYCINAARYLFRTEPEEVFASCARDTDDRFHDVDESTTAILRFSNGRMAQITCSLAAAAVSTLHVVGTRGDLRMDPAFGYDKPLVHHLTVDGQTLTKSFAVRDQFAPELIAFSNAIRQGRDPEPCGYEGLADVRIMRAILESARTGRSVRLPRFSRSERPNVEQAIYKPPVVEVEPIDAPSPILT